MQEWPGRGTRQAQGVGERSGLRERVPSSPDAHRYEPRGNGGSAAAEGEKLNGLLLRVRKWGFYIVLESDLMGWQVRGPSTFLPSEATRNERSFEKERQRTPRQREWTAKHPLPCRGRGGAGEWDQFTRVSIEQHGGSCFLPTLKIP